MAFFTINAYDERNLCSTLIIVKIKCTDFYLSWIVITVTVESPIGNNSWGQEKNTKAVNLFSSSCIALFSNGTERMCGYTEKVAWHYFWPLESAKLGI